MIKTREQLEHDIVVLKMRLENAGQEIQRFADINRSLHAELLLERNKVKQFEIQKEINDSIIQKQINKSNEENNANLERIDFLTRKLREYGYND